jgi:hypothetical protein
METTLYSIPITCQRRNISLTCVRYIDMYEEKKINFWIGSNVWL